MTLPGSLSGRSGGAVADRVVLTSFAVPLVEGVGDQIVIVSRRLVSAAEVAGEAADVELPRAKYSIHRSM